MKALSAGTRQVDLLSCLVGTRLGSITLAELLNTAGGIDELLLACVEGMACAADFHAKLSDCRLGSEAAATAAGHTAVDVVGMNAVLHNLHQRPIKGHLQRAKTAIRRSCAVS